MNINNLKTYISKFNLESLGTCGILVSLYILKCIFKKLLVKISKKCKKLHSMYVNFFNPNSVAVSEESDLNQV